MLARMLFLALAIVVLVETATLATVFVRARRQRQLPETFRCRTRRPDPRGRRGDGSSARWRLGWASWAHGVLLVRSGVLGRIDVLPVRFPEGGVKRVAATTVSRLGPAPVVVLLRLDDGRLLELAAPAQARELVAGPFLAACVLTPDR